MQGNTIEVPRQEVSGSYAVFSKQRSVQIALVEAYNQALQDADEEMAKYLGPTHKARLGVAKRKKL